MVQRKKERCILLIILSTVPKGTHLLPFTKLLQNTLLALLDTHSWFLVPVLISLQCCQGLVKLLVWRAWQTWHATAGRQRFHCFSVVCGGGCQTSLPPYTTASVLCLPVSIQRPWFSLTTQWWYMFVSQSNQCPRFCRRRPKMVLLPAQHRRQGTNRPQIGWWTSSPSIRHRRSFEFSQNPRWISESAETFRWTVCWPRRGKRCRNLWTISLAIHGKLM